MKNLKQVSLLCSTFLIINANAQINKSISGFNHIESVATDGNYIYVADIGKELNPTVKDWNGKIYKLDLTGITLDSNFVKEVLNAPKGLAFNNGVLYLTDIDRILAINVKTGNKLFEIDFSKDASFLNDISVWDNNIIYVSATDKNKIFKVNLKDKSYSEIKTDKVIAGTNGIFCDKKSNRIYVNGFGSDNKPNGIVGYINIENDNFTQLTAIEGYFDGIFISNNILYLSNWVAFEKKGIIQSIQLSDNKVSEIKIPETIAGPADFIIIKNQLIVPAMISGTLHFISLVK